MKEGTSVGTASSLLRCSWLVVLAGITVVTAVLERPDAWAVAGYSRSHYVLPPEVRKAGISFAGVKISLERKDVSERVAEQVNYLLMDRRAGMMEWFDRMEMYGPIIRKVLAEEKMPADLIYMVALLSDLLPNTKTKTGGVGWWTLGSVKDKSMPQTVQWLVTNEWDDRRDPVLSTRIACTMFQWLLSRKETNGWLMAICAFVDGTEPLDAAVKKASGFSYWDLLLPPRSDVFVPRLIALKIIDSHREFYAVNVSSPPPVSFDFFERLKLLKDLPLYVVAQWCGTTPRQIWELNPGVNPATGVLPQPDRRNPVGFPLRVPKGMGEKVRKLLAKEGYLSG